MGEERTKIHEILFLNKQTNKKNNKTEDGEETWGEERRRREKDQEEEGSRVAGKGGGEGNSREGCRHLGRWTNWVWG